MTIFGRYLSRRFFGPFLFGLGLFAVLVFLIDVFDKVNKLATTPAPVLQIAEYLALTIPYWTIRIVPMASLLATLFAVTGFVRSGEYTAVQASGFEPSFFFRPILYFAAAIGLTAFLAQETVLPAAFARSQRIWREAIHPEWKWDVFSDAILTPSPSRLVGAREFFVAEGRIHRAVIDDYSEGMLRSQIDALEASWDESSGIWVLRRGTVKTFDEKGGLIAESSFEEMPSDLRIPPRQLIPKKKLPDEMNIREAYAELRRLESLGRSSRGVRTALHQKIAYPFTNIVLCLFGIPIALRLRRSPPPVAFAAALVISFAYMWLIEIGGHLGKSGFTLPFLAAWTPNLVFGISAAWMFRQVDR